MIGRLDLKANLLPPPTSLETESALRCPGRAFHQIACQPQARSNVPALRGERLRQDGPPVNLTARRPAGDAGGGAPGHRRQGQQYPPGLGIAELRRAVAAQRSAATARSSTGDGCSSPSGASEAIAAPCSAWSNQLGLLLEALLRHHAPVIAMAGAPVPARPGARRPRLRRGRRRAVGPAIGPDHGDRRQLPHNPTGMVLGDDDLSARWP